MLYYSCENHHGHCDPRETGFYYLQSRYYDPSIGRFINADSFASTGQGFVGYNMFAYCDNNPTNMMDISGDVGIIATIFAWLVKHKVILICAGSTIIGSGFGALNSYLTGGSKEEIYQSAFTGAIDGLANSLPGTRTATKVVKTAVNIYGVVDSFSSVWEQNGSASDMFVVGFAQYISHEMYGDLGQGVLYDFAFTFPMDLANEALIKIVNASNPSRDLPPIFPPITAYDVLAICAVGAGCKPDHYLFLQKE